MKHEFIYKGPFTNSSLYLSQTKKNYNHGDKVILDDNQINNPGVKHYIEQGKTIPNYTHRLISTKSGTEESLAKDELGVVTEKKKEIVEIREDQSIDLGNMSDQQILDFAKGDHIKVKDNDIQKAKGLIKIKYMSVQFMNDNFTKDELNDFAAIHGFGKEIKGYDNKPKTIRKLKNLLK